MALSSILNNVLYAIPLIKILHIKPVRIPTKYCLQTIVPIAVGRAIAVASSYFGLWKVSVSYAQTGNVLAKRQFSKKIIADLLLFAYFLRILTELSNYSAEVK